MAAAAQAGVVAGKAGAAISGRLRTVHPGGHGGSALPVPQISVVPAVRGSQQMPVPPPDGGSTMVAGFCPLAPAGQLQQASRPGSGAMGRCPNRTSAVPSDKRWERDRAFRDSPDPRTATGGGTKDTEPERSAPPSGSAPAG